jgi:hypothetical protein
MLKIKSFSDDRGILNVIECGVDIDFTIKRVYYIHNNSANLTRGFHAHKKLKQLMVCITGSVEVELNNGTDVEVHRLDNHDKGLLIDFPAWRVLRDFSEDALVVVFASEVFIEDDYIKNYEEFLDYAKKINK